MEFFLFFTTCPCVFLGFVLLLDEDSRAQVTGGLTKRWKTFHNSQEAIFFLILAGLEEQTKKSDEARKDAEQKEEVRWEERKEVGNKGGLLHFLDVLIYILRSISVWCSSQASPHFPAPQMGLF